MRRIERLNRDNPAVLRQIESALRNHSPTRRTSGTLQRMTKPDATLALIAARFARYDVEKSGRGYAILDRRTANPIARLCPIKDTDRFELFYWSNTKGRWTTFGNLGRMKLMLESAHEIVENDPMFRVSRYRMDRRSKRKHSAATAAIGATTINDRIGTGLGWVLNRLLRTARIGRG